MHATKRCAACHFPVSVSSPGPHVCAQCGMIADGRTYADGSSPAEGLSESEVAYIRLRVTSVRNVRASR